jgi:hypothetical protein
LLTAAKGRNFNPLKSTAVQGVEFLEALAMKYNLFDLYARKTTQYGNILHRTKFTGSPEAKF